MKFKNSKNKMSVVMTVLAAMLMVMCATVVIASDSEDSDATESFTLTNETITLGDSYSKIISGQGMLEKSYYTLSGASWLSLSDSSSAYLTANGTPTVAGTYNVTVTGPFLQGSLTGVWTWTVTVVNSTTYTVNIYDRLSTLSSSATLSPGSTYTLPTQSDNYSYSFLGYYTAASGGSYVGTSGTVITVNSDRNIYTHWAVRTYYNISFDLNGYYYQPGTVSSYAEKWNVNTESGTTFNLSSQNSTVNSGYIYDCSTNVLVNPTFLGWSETATGSVVSYSSFTVTSAKTFYAIWETPEPTTKIITYNENGGTPSGNVTTTVNVLSGNSYTLLTKGFSKTGYYLSSWNTSANGSGTSYALGKTITMPASDLTLYAQWTALPDTNDGSAPTTAIIGVLYSYKPDSDGDNWWTIVKEILYSGSATVTTYPDWMTTHSVTKNSILFSGTPGTDDAGVYTVVVVATHSNSYTVTISWVITVSPANEGVNYTITYNANGGTGTEDTVTGSADTIIILPSYSVAGFSKEGYTLGGWSTTIDGTTVIYPLGSIYTIHSDKTFSAYWVANTHVIVFDVNGGSGENAYQTADTDGLVTLPSEGYTKSGCSLNGWYISSDPTTIYAIGYTYQVSSTTVFKAYWVETGTTTLKVTFNANGGVGGFTMNVESGKKVVMPVYGTTFSEHTLQKWNSAADGSGTEYAMGSSVSITSAKTFYAQWVENTSTTFTVTFNLNGGQGSIAPQVLNSGDTISLPNNPTRYGYIFSYWKNSESGEWDFTTGVTSDVTLIAQWTQLASLTTNGTTVTVTIGNNYKSGTSTIVWGDSSENSTGVSATFTHDYGQTSSGTISVSVVLSGVTYSTSLLYSVTASESGGSGDGGNEDDNNDGNNEQSNNNWIIFAIVIILLILGMAVIMVII